MRLQAVLFWMLVFAVSAAPVVAQDTDPQDRDPELPDIAPHEIEIRGQLEISFPALERQPLVGFNPPPRVPSVPDDYEPFIEEYRQDPDAQRQRLPDRYTLPQLGDRPDPNVGELEAQIGRYFSRIGRARFDLPLSERQRLSFDLDYEGQDRYTPFQDTTFAPYDIFDGQVRFSSSHDAITWGVDLTGQLDRYAMHQPFLQEPGATVGSRFPLREHYGGEGATWIRYDGAVPTSFRTYYGEQFFDRPEEPGAPDHARENRFGADLQIEPAIGQRRATLGLATDFANQTVDGTAGQSVGIARATAVAPIIQGGAFEIEVGVSGFVGTSNEGGIDTDNLDYYASPIVRASWQASTTLSFYAQNEPSARLNGWQQLFDTNPYLEATPFSAPTVNLVDAEGGANIFLDPVQINLYGGAIHAPNFRYFHEADETYNFESRITTSYAQATNILAGADISIHMSDAVHASVGGKYQHARLDETGSAVPYVAPFEVHGMLSWRVADRGLIQLTAEYLDSRPISAEFDEAINPYLSMNARGVYDFNSNIGIIVEAQNIGPESMLERWNYHPHPPLTITTGLRVRL